MENESAQSTVERGQKLMGRDKDREWEMQAVMHAG